MSELAPRILAFAGSARTASINKKLAAAAAGYAREAGAEVTVADLRDFAMPLYDGDLEEAEGTPDGARLSLQERDGEYILRLNGAALMSSSWTTSDLALADAACFGMRKNGCVLIGGLGLGYSLRRVLEICGRDANVVQAELIEDVVTWNRESLRQLNGNLLEDPRVEVFVGDVYACIKDAEPGQFDAILLDVDNGPTSLVEPSNMRLYTERGFEAIRRSLREGGKVAF